MIPLLMVVFILVEMSLSRSWTVILSPQPLRQRPHLLHHLHHHRHQPTPSGCDGVTKTVETDTGDFELLKQESKVVTVTVTDAGGCPVADKKVFARINRAGKKRIKISSSIETTDENGATAFTITAKKKTVKATVTFKSGGIKKKITANVVSE